VPVETPDTTSFLRRAPRGCAELFKKVVPFKVVLFQGRAVPSLWVGGIANIRRPS
jgi:hypothetical protein